MIRRLTQTLWTFACDHWLAFILSLWTFACDHWLAFILFGLCLTFISLLGLWGLSRP
jgi:hypothetical protein